MNNELAMLPDKFPFCLTLGLTGRIIHSPWSKEWRKQTVPSEIIQKQTPPLVQTDVSIHDSSQLQHTYHLPGQMKLGNVMYVSLQYQRQQQPIKLKQQV